VRYADAFSIDRHRGCLVDLPTPPSAARTEIAKDRREKRAALLSLQAKVLGEHGARRGSGRPRSDRLYRGNQAGFVDFSEAVIEGALSPYVRHPAPVVYLFAEFIYVTFATHPDAVRRIDRALDPRNLPQPPWRRSRLDRRGGDLSHGGGAGHRAHTTPPE
jgi:hypothetical protein